MQRSKLAGIQLGDGSCDAHHLSQTSRMHFPVSDHLFKIFRSFLPVMRSTIEWLSSSLSSVVSGVLRDVRLVVLVRG